MSEKNQLRIIELSGFFGAVVVCIIAALLVDKMNPQFTVVILSTITYYLGKLLGKPIHELTIKSVTSWPPAIAAQVLQKIADKPAEEQKLIQMSMRPGAAVNVQFINSDEVTDAEKTKG